MATAAAIGEWGGKWAAGRGGCWCHLPYALRRESSTHGNGGDRPRKGWVSERPTTALWLAVAAAGRRGGGDRIHPLTPDGSRFD